ncbi:hypothetical protein HBH99_151160 [Parastagonospora nodorum]|nr:hypothetical protein HBI13_141110 [Parastagonospora nodorum]KAH4391446.1 hypothetical protein HBH99_151160 [Parastagonospora nodorum]KAH4699163.1 hypothetical protein HBH67_166420 [Parastagonospora nodorum]
MCGSDVFRRPGNGSHVTTAKWLSDLTPPLLGPIDPNTITGSGYNLGNCFATQCPTHLYKIRSQLAQEALFPVVNDWVKAHYKCLYVLTTILQPYCKGNVAASASFEGSKPPEVEASRPTEAPRRLESATRPS